MTPPADPLQLAVGLVHEFQHAKLNALLYLIDLYRGDRPPRHYSPWRNDPRPLGGVLHGAYAYLAVADFWRTQRRHVDSELAATAEFEFRRWRGAVDRTVRAMRRTERFTSAGLRLLDGMQRALSQWPREVPAHPRLPVLAGDALEDHHALWRLRHLHPRSTAVAELCAAWRDSRPPRPEAPLRVECTLTAGDPGSQEDSERLLLVQRMLRDAGEPGLDGEVSPREAKCGPLGAGDAAYACGKADIAAHAYLAALAGDPESIEAWAGLTVAWRRTGRPEGKALAGAPELVRAVYVTLHASGRTPDVGALARWLGDAARTCAESW